ncbi:hypothetical protein MIND_01218500 [Mycena indigotica]|uniref:Uncharacterized protein n=1 Tax=Mycena indigotica TaxID=2126181 RepID=A0A8H6S494_9AGAR|nr:uncharacterized protein MIND_01218500 [Mycena indigotica]KAF7291930.1 hypothetical protein MIND_01218500 [Mycena indigotica]
MPHKRAKRSLRDAHRTGQGIDNAPAKDHTDSLSSEPLPKSFVRAINAVHIRAEYRAKRKLREEDGPGDGNEHKGKRSKTEANPSEATKIRPGETLAHFNKRIEGDMRPVVRNAMQASRALQRAQKKTELAAKHDKKANGQSRGMDSDNDNDTPINHQAKPADISRKPKDFQLTSTAAPRRLNDIAQAPPDLSALVKKAQKKPGGAKVGVGKEKAKEVVSPAQQLLLAQAREEAIRKYRELKAKRLIASQTTD